MQCNWQKFARRLVSHSSQLRTIASTACKRTKQAHFAFSNTNSTELSTLNTTLKSSQKALAASQAISHALRDRNLTDAYHIANSLRLAHLQSPGTQVIGKVVDHLTPVADAFGPDVSPRLPSHTLLHGLIRMGEISKASSLAEQMIANGMNVRCRTIEALYTTMASTSQPPTEAPKQFVPFTRLDIHTFQSSQEFLAKASTIDGSTGFALRLLALARQSRQRRSRNMFKTLLALCLINGEIILGSIIFGILVRDWQTRSEMVSVACQDPATPSSKGGPPTRTFRIPPHTIYDTPAPTKTRLRDLCAYIDFSMLNRPLSTSPIEQHLAYRASLQALANLASMLDSRELPFSQVNPLLSALVGYQKFRMNKTGYDTEELVWVPMRPLSRRGIEIDAAKYFDAVLRRLISSLPARPTVHSLVHNDPKLPLPYIPPPPHPKYGHSKRALPPLDISSYNTLLHFCFQNRNSPHRAKEVLNHMVNVRESPLAPDAVTMNIISNGERKTRVVWCADLLNANSVASKAPFASPRPRPSPFSSRSYSTHAVYGETPHTIQDPIPHSIQDPEAATLIALLESATMTGNYHTLGTYISTLTAIGRPHIVADCFPLLFPGIAMGREEDLEMWRARKATSAPSIVQRAVEFGPVLLTSILAALMKEGHTGWADRLFRYSCQAERASWEVSYIRPGAADRVVTPWLFGVQTYTVMIQLYGKEGSKGAGYGHGPIRKHGLLRQRWHGMTLNPRKEPRERYAIGRLAALDVYKHVHYVSKRDHVGEKLAKLQMFLADQPSDDGQQVKLVLKKKHLQDLIPDAGFFNAVLKVIGKRPGMRPRSSKAGRSRMRRLWQRRRSTWIWSGQTQGYQPDVEGLERILKDMTSAGFGVPIFWRRLLVGRSDLDLGDPKDEGGLGRIYLRT